jgi:hypothetical protein
MSQGCYRSAADCSSVMSVCSAKGEQVKGCYRGTAGKGTPTHFSQLTTSYIRVAPGLHMRYTRFTRVTQAVHKCHTYATPVLHKCYTRFTRGLHELHKRYLGGRRGAPVLARYLNPPDVTKVSHSVTQVLYNFSVGVTQDSRDI